MILGQLNSQPGSMLVKATSHWPPFSKFKLHSFQKAFMGAPIPSSSVHWPLSNSGFPFISLSPDGNGVLRLSGECRGEYYLNTLCHSEQADPTATETWSDNGISLPCYHASVPLASVMVGDNQWSSIDCHIIDCHYCFFLFYSLKFSLL